MPPFCSVPYFHLVYRPLEYMIRPLSDVCQEKYFRNRTFFMIGHRLEIYVKTKGIDFAELSRITGVAHGALSEIKAGKREPRANNIAKIITNTDINPMWLLTGKGPMCRPPDSIELTGDLDPITRIFDTEEDIEALKNLVEVLRSGEESTKQHIRQSLREVTRLIKLASQYKDSAGTSGPSPPPEQKREKHQEGGS